LEINVFHKLFLIFFIFLIRSSSYADDADSKLLIYGDSISAGYGMAYNKQWSLILEDTLEKNNIGVQVINKSISGETTGGGLVRFERILQEFKPTYILLELGGNDALRGYPPSTVKRNLEKMIIIAQENSAETLLMQIKIPPNYGRKYQERFESIYPDIASKTSAKLIPFMLDDIALNADLMLRDGIHPNEKAQSLIADIVYRSLLPYLKN
jgi:acyl-CoA thioesterase-1